jgi:hypothetical protein
MKNLGLLMITIGFLAAALVSVEDQDEVRWGYFVPAVAVGIAGVVVTYLARRRAKSDEDKIATNMQTIETALAGIVKNITHLKEQRQSINTYDMRHRIDELFPENLAAFVQARESIAHVFGLSAYGDVMSCFAAGERYLNRIWSASADGYIDEVNTFMDKAQAQFVESLDKIRQLKTRAESLSIV